MSEFEKNQANALLVLTGFWIILTLIIVSTVIYTGWRKEQLQLQQTIKLTTNHIKNNLDGLISEVRESIYSLSLLESKTGQCSPKIRKALNTTVFNHPKISGLSVFNLQNQMICSTLGDVSNQTIRLRPSQHLVGPINHDSNRGTAFIIQQSMRQYRFEIYLLQSTLASSLETESRLVNHVSLIHSSTQKPALEIVRNSRDHWKVLTNRSDEAFNNNTFFSYSESLQELPNYKIRITSTPVSLFNISWQYELLSIALLLFFSSTAYYALRKFLFKRFSLKRAIQQGITNNSFFPEYQPIYDLEEKTYTGVEVLMRWRTHDNETIMPDFFIEEAEVTGLIVPISKQVIEKTFIDFHRLLKNKSEFHLGFNLSFAHLVDRHFFSAFEGLSKQYDIHPKQILFEITEREILSHQNDHIAEKMNDLRQKGYRLAIDDFGTGYASLSYLRHFPFDYLKIDKLFIGAIGTGAVTEALNESIIQLAKNLNLTIIAEGVESEVQVDYLKLRGVQLIQGWYYAKAMPIYQLVSLLQGVEYDEG